MESTISPSIKEHANMTILARDITTTIRDFHLWWITQNKLAFGVSGVQTLI